MGAMDRSLVTCPPGLGMLEEEEAPCTLPNGEVARGGWEKVRD